MGLLIGAPFLMFGIDLNDENYKDRFLFCLRSEYSQLEINYLSDDRTFSIDNNKDINEFLSSYDIVGIERWMPNANEKDNDQGVYLNRIYRAKIENGRADELPSIINKIQLIPSVLYAEPENIHKITYTPNDPNADGQCSLNSMKVSQAWDFWDIANGINFPGNDNQNYVLLASVDTGVDYSHPDLQNNAWINQGEIPSWTFEAGLDTNNDGFIEASELVLFFASQGMDFNGDGEYDLRDVVYEDSDSGINSPFLDGIDGDGNSYTDDILGWDCSGYYGTSSQQDPDPFPKEDATNNGTWAHGTHVAGILAATTDNSMGMASASYNAKFISVKASRDNQAGEPGINHGYQGILYAAKAGHNDLNGNGTWDPGESFAIINNSWGGGGYSGSENATINTAHNTYGAVVVAAAGNGDDAGGDEYAAHYPSSYENCISVCAMGCSGNWGNWATYHPTVDLGAPGESIFSAIIGSGYESWDGSSMASPNAASAIGLLSYYYPNFNNDQLRERIESTADQVVYELSPEFIDCNGSSGEYCLGAGMVDVYKAIGLTFSPSISFNSYSISLLSGDGDSVLDPGESAELVISIENEQGWTDAMDVNIAISCNDPSVHIINNSASYGNIANGFSFNNSSNPFSFYTDAEVQLGDINFELLITAAGNDGYAYENILDLNIPVSLDQGGFPFATDFEIKSSPLVVDFDNDGSLELIFGDKNGLVHVVSSSGVEWDNDIFPFDTGNEIWGSLAYGDIDLDGLNEIIVPSKSKHLFAIDVNGVDFDFDAGQYLMGTPSIGNLDDDEYLEVVVSGYSSGGDIFIVNHDGSVDTIVEINEKSRGGASLADFNNDEIDEIIIATENNDMICKVDYAGNIDTLLVIDDNFKASPSILDIDGQKTILIGSHDKSFYAINSEGENVFTVDVEDEINSTASLLENNSNILIFFGSDDGFLHGLHSNGQLLSGWPVNLGGEVGSPVFSDLDGDGDPEVIVGAGNKIYAIGLDGVSYNSNHFPIQVEFSVTSAPIIADIDNDNDVEIVIGSLADLIVIDIMEQGGVSSNYWSMDKGGNDRTGLYIASSSCGSGQLGDLNCDENIDIFDIIIIVNIILNQTVPDSSQLWSSDYNQDGNIDILDITEILNLILD